MHATFVRCVLAMVLGLMVAPLAHRAAAADPGRQESCKLDRTIKVSFQYLLYLPKDYEEKQSWPLLLFLHGSGERGDNLELVKKHGPPRLIAEGKQFPFIVVSPQCPSGRSWEPFELTALLDEIVEKYKVDPERVYLTGLSMGGFGTWSLAMHTPNRFAALVPICGGGDPLRTKRIAHLPVWVFHGAKDTAVSLEMSQKMVDALKKNGADVKFTVYPEAGHDAWTEAYANPELYEWLLRQKRTVAPESKQQHSRRMGWWQEARFGMFIHWGLYAIPAGEWKGKTNHAEWIRHSAQIPIDEYDKFVGRFDPVQFNADRWVTIAKNAGARYIVITSKHHDGFCLFSSKYTDYNVMSTPWKRDIMQELADACRRQGIRICWYHSIMDWHHPDYLPRRKWENRPAEGADYERYVAHLKNQLRELLTNYGKIGVLWFDGEWEDTWTHEHGQSLYNYVRGLDPDIIINNRVDKGRRGMAGLTKEGSFAGDFGTPEQEIPATGLPGTDWETCMTMNDHWGYNQHDQHWKSKEDLIRKLADIASKGGNFLLNVGPTAEGLIPQPSVERLEAIGQWMKSNGESIYGTGASPFEKLAWGRCTQKQLPDGTTALYLHVFQWPHDGKLNVPALKNKIAKAWLLTDTTRAPLPVAREQGQVVVSVAAESPDPIDTVVVLTMEGRPAVMASP